MSSSLKMNARNFTMFTELVNTVGGFANYLFNYEPEEENVLLEDAKEKIMYPIEDLYNTCKMMSPDENAEYSYSYFEIIRIVLEGISDNIDDMISIFDTKTKNPKDKKLKDVVIPEEIEVNVLIELNHFMDQLYMMVSADWATEIADGKDINDFLSGEINIMKEDVEELLDEESDDDEDDEEESDECCEDDDEENDDDEYSDNDDEEESDEEEMEDESDDENDEESKDDKKRYREGKDIEYSIENMFKRVETDDIYQVTGTFPVEFTKAVKIPRNSKIETAVIALIKYARKNDLFEEDYIQFTGLLRIVFGVNSMKISQVPQKVRAIATNLQPIKKEKKQERDVYAVGNDVQFVYSSDTHKRKVTITQNLPDRIFANESGKIKCFLKNKIHDVDFYREL